MKTRINHQIIEHEGKPIFVVVPYEEYLDLTENRDDEVTIPHAVVEKMLLEEKSLICAWREYRKLSQTEVAEQMGITQPAYSQMEKPDARLRRKTIERIAAALNVIPEQLTED